MNKKIGKFSKTILFLWLVVFPLVSSASSLGFVLPSKKIFTEDTFVAELRLVAGREEINAIDGELKFDPEVVSVKEISTGGSIFSIWARTPVFSNDSGKILFAGGTPNGIKQDGLIFKVIFIAQKPGLANFTVSPNTNLYLNDGQGTITRPILNKGEMAIQSGSAPTSTNAWQQELENDKLGPVDLSVLIGRDPAVFNGKYFLTITARDEQSGMDHFEVKEGDRGYIRTESPYVLQDQSLKSELIVLAVDKAGNASVIKHQPTVTTTKQDNKWLWMIILLAVILLSVVIFVLIFKIKNKNTPKRKNVSKRKTKTSK
ncbi:MAG: hypothetical protein QG603_806 [Patescibacteria group bacterium]|nr:hypothetical protein [Patescibacteria group bacterium]MDQ5971029.1 hypothetical protein [Patescibacteria group bacterium]